MKFFITFLLLASCSLGRFFIGSLDNYVTAKTADRLQLYTKQETSLGLDIQKLFNEVKPQAKIIYSHLDAQRKTDSYALSSEKRDLVLQAFVEVYHLGINLINKYNQMMSQKQLSLFLKEYKKKIEKKRKRLKVKRYKRILPERFEEIFGELNSLQTKLLKDNAEIFMLFNKKRFEEEETHFNDLTEASKAENIENRNKLIDQSYHKIKISSADHFKNELPKVLKIINEFMKTLSKKQKEEFKEDLDLALDIFQAFLKHKY